MASKKTKKTKRQDTYGLPGAPKDPAIHLDGVTASQVVREIQQFMYLREGTKWLPDDEVNGGDLVDHVDGVLKLYGLAPPQTFRATIEVEVEAADEKAARAMFASAADRAETVPGVVRIKSDSVTWVEADATRQASDADIDADPELREYLLP